MPDITYGNTCLLITMIMIRTVLEDLKSGVELSHTLFVVIIINIHMFCSLEEIPKGNQVSDWR